MVRPAPDPPQPAFSSTFACISFALQPTNAHPCAHSRTHAPMHRTHMLTPPSSLRFPAHRCHAGPCPDTCREVVSKRCPCGSTTRRVLCTDSFRCERKCARLRECGRHPCKRRCCTGDCPPCEESCNKWLRCTNHRCRCCCWHLLAGAAFAQHTQLLPPCPPAPLQLPHTQQTPPHTHPPHLQVPSALSLGSMRPLPPHFPHRLRLWGHSAGCALWEGKHGSPSQLPGGMPGARPLPPLSPAQAAQVGLGAFVSGVEGPQG